MYCGGAGTIMLALDEILLSGGGLSEAALLQIVFVGLPMMMEGQNMINKAVVIE
ncbi:hypothetical protein [Methanothermobacter tenebrarum]|uniref:hypothetical protein n=1 Tax=Methanothermobacter tenebrarum TaxID=680118 RepID=UPI0015ECD2C7|nr:hypothetical protein [Methanothermobacter tenebrarum]NPV64739.1 hypothetical protein [Methanobacteriaceae archaeon]